MGRAETSNPASINNLDPQELQVKIYQAFIFSIPILFSMMLLLLFYLFYLKKRASDLSPPPHLLASNQDFTLTPSDLQVGIKGDLKDKLLVVQFDEELRAKDSQCCVCLGEFELKQELRQVQYCKHVYHSDCIRGWLKKKATCPLCRCNVITSINPQPQCHQEGSVDDDSHHPGAEEGRVIGDLPRNEQHVLYIELEPSNVGPPQMHQIV